MSKNIKLAKKTQDLEIFGFFSQNEQLHAKIYGKKLIYSEKRQKLK